MHWFEFFCLLTDFSLWVSIATENLHRAHEPFEVDMDAHIERVAKVLPQKGDAAALFKVIRDNSFWGLFDKRTN